MTKANGMYSLVRVGDEECVQRLKSMAAADPAVITLFLLPELNYCFSAIPCLMDDQPCEGDDEKKDVNARYAVFCRPSNDGFVWGHELGHHFCLSHTFSFQDPATHNPPNHDGDGLQDTPPDPGEFEHDNGKGVCTPANPGCDGPLANPFNGHEWCERFLATNVLQGSQNAPYYGSGQYVQSLQCRERQNNVTQNTAYTLSVTM